MMTGNIKERLQSFRERIFRIEDSKDPQQEFNSLALEAFEIQRESCPVYREYLNLVEKGDFHPASFEEIPFLPIRLFKSRNILTDPSVQYEDYCRRMDLFREKVAGEEIGLVFTSSATTGMTPSRHLVPDVSIYERSFREGFRLFYGESGTYNLLALLPSYLEREGSSLVYMADKLIADAKENGAEGGFFLYDHDKLLETVKNLSTEGRLLQKSLPASSCGKTRRRTILLGVSFALLDFAKFVAGHIPDVEERRLLFSDVTIMETGGMKGRGEELSREELHRRLRDGFRTDEIHSEYGMCELFSQAYSFPATDLIQHRPTDLIQLSQSGMFFCPPWMRVLTRDLQDPFKILSAGQDKHNFQEGGLDIIDLANINSCCFIETEDRGKILYGYQQNSCSSKGKKSIHPPFTVDGRIKDAELRGCNMLIE